MKGNGWQGVVLTCKFDYACCHLHQKFFHLLRYILSIHNWSNSFFKNKKKIHMLNIYIYSEMFWLLTLSRIDNRKAMFLCRMITVLKAIVWRFPDVVLRVYTFLGLLFFREEIQQCLESILHRHVNLDSLPRDITATWFCNKVLKL